VRVEDHAPAKGFPELPRLGRTSILCMLADVMLGEELARKVYEEMNCAESAY
jgi:hypothetical protein